jgi:regulator of ribonuclease activity A
MNDILPAICDKYEDQVTLLDLPLQNFGQRFLFFGEVVTVRCFQDTSKVLEVLQQNGKGKVLFVDGNGSCKKALFGTQLAILAVENDWEGVIIYGALRDVATLSEIDLGIKALAPCPFRTVRHGSGDINVSLTMNSQTVLPGDYIYADWNGILISHKELEL